MPAARSACARCGGPKPPGRGLRYCDACPRVRVLPKGEKTPCRQCGSTEGKRHGKQLCDDCKALSDWRRLTRKRETKRKACLGCGGPKGSGRWRRYCDACQSRREAPPLCRKCGERPVRRRLAHLCESCAETAAARRRELHRLNSRERRARDLEAARAEARVRWHAMHADPVRHARELERRRMAYRAKRFQQGLVVRESGAGEAGRGPSLPGPPLAAAVRAYEARQRRGRNPFAVVDSEGDRFGQLAVVCERAGVNERVLAHWASGQGVSLPLADRVLTRLGLAWWEVWSEESVHEPLFVAVTYTFQVKRIGGGERRRIRIRSRARAYGDLGTDFAELRRIEQLMTGEQVAA